MVGYFDFFRLENNSKIRNDIFIKVMYIFARDLLF
jgi:hypothetical protein